MYLFRVFYTLNHQTIRLQSHVRGFILCWLPYVGMKKLCKRGNVAELYIDKIINQLSFGSQISENKVSFICEIV